MRLQILYLYTTLFELTGWQIFSLSVAVAYITALNYISIYGVGILFRSIFHSFFYKLFSIPYCGGMLVLIMLINFIAIQPLEIFSKKKQKNTALAIATYTTVSVLIIVFAFVTGQRI